MHVRQDNSAKELVKRAVMPYMHKMAHGLKNVGSRYGVQILFSAKNKIGRLCSLVNKKRPHNASFTTSKVKHTRAFVPCKMRVVYQILLSCITVYVGHMGAAEKSTHRR